MADAETTTALRIVTKDGQKDVPTREAAAAAFREHFTDPRAGFIEVWEVATDGTNWCQELWRFDPPRAAA